MLVLSLKKSNIKWMSLGWVIPDLPLKRLGADALCQLMFRVMPVSLKDSLMRPRQARCAQPSGAENLKANRSMSALVLERGKKRGGNKDLQVLEGHYMRVFEEKEKEDFVQFLFIWLQKVLIQHIFFFKWSQKVATRLIIQNFFLWRWWGVRRWVKKDSSACPVRLWVQP